MNKLRSNTGMNVRLQKEKGSASKRIFTPKLVLTRRKKERERAGKINRDGGGIALLKNGEGNHFNFLEEPVAYRSEKAKKV